MPTGDLIWEKGEQLLVLPHPAPCTLHPAAGEKKAAMPTQQTVAEMGVPGQGNGAEMGGLQQKQLLAH